MRVCPYCHLLLPDSESACPHDAAPTGPAEPAPVPAALQPKFKDVQPFAQGQTGTLHLARQAQSGFRGLLKVIPLAGFEGSERVRLKRELRKQNKLAHDGLPRIIDGGEAGQDLWLLREFVAGESLAQRIRRLGRLEVQEALLIAAQVASALDELQRNGLLHRDVKPGHVILEPGAKGMPISKLIDAGVAARLATGSVFDLVGTPAYISPEQVAGKLVSFRSDLYALGCMLFEMLTGRPPFTGDDVKAVLEAHKSAPVPDPDAALPSQALTLLRALLAKEPRQRPFSAQQVRRTLEPLLPPGAPLPVLQSRAPSSAGGISAPPPAAGERASAPGMPPRRPRASTPPAPPLAARAGRGRAGSPPGEEEIDLAEIELPSSDARAPSTIRLDPDDIEEIDSRGQSTLNLSADDVDALEVREEAAALMQAVSREPEELAQDTGQVAAIALASATAAAESAHAAPQSPALAPEAAEPARESAASDAAAANATPSAQSGGRRAVSFDVESLFDDDVPGEPEVRAPTVLQDAAPTQIYRPKSDAPPAPAALGRSRPVEEPDRDPEGTVLVARPGAKPPRRTPWLWIGAGAALLLLLVIVFSGGDDENAVAEGEVTTTPLPADKPADEPVPSAAAPSAPKPAPLPAKEPPSSAAADEAPAPAQPTPEQLAAAQPDPADAPAAEPAAAEPAPAKTAEPAPAAAAKAAEPAPAKTAEPAPAKTAAAAPGKSTARTTNAAPGAQQEPPMSAAAASAKLGPSAGSKLTPPRGSRADRVAKSDELKAQARAHYQAGRFREAATAYQSATELDPSDAGAFAGLAASRLSAGDPNAAIAAYSRAVRLQPSSSGFHAALGRAYLAAGDRNRARAAYQKALQLNPENGAAKTALEQLR